MKKLTASVAQMTCLDGKTENNLAHAYELACEARHNNSELVLFPEFMTPGYRLTEDIWNSAEPWDGPTTSWLSQTARELSMYVGSSFLEARNGHFFNTFAMAGPSGRIAGTVRKRYPSMWEAYFFKGSDDSHVFETEIGRVGIGICFDNHTHTVASLISGGNPDLILMPHSYCTPTIPGKFASGEDIKRLNGLPGMVARLYNKFTGVPVVLCNKSGIWASPVPNKIFGSPENFRFSGRSTIIDCDGNVITELDDKESVATGTVSLDADLKRNGIIPRYSRYIYPGPAGREIIRLMELQGKISYTLSRTRKNKASSCLSMTGSAAINQKKL